MTGPVDTSARLAEDRTWLETERLLASARLVAAVVGVANLLLQQFSGPAWTQVLAWTGILAAAGSSLVVLRRVTDGRLTVVTADRAAWLETLGIGALLPVATDEHTAYVVLVLLMMSVLASLRDGRRGLRRAMVVGIPAEATRLALGIALVDHVHVEDTVTGIVLALAFGVLVGHVAEVSRDRGDRAQQAARHLEVQRRVVLAGVGGGEDEALLRMAQELGALMGAVSVTIVLQSDDTGPVVAATTDRAVRRRPRPEPLPGGPLDRTLRQGEACLATPAQVDAMARVLPRRGAMATAPIRRGDEVLGALCVDTPPGRGLDADDLDMVAQLADHMALVIDAARSLDHESDLAERFRELDRLKTDFVAITSHELRTPLTTILGVIETMRTRREDLGPDETHRLVGALSRQAERLSRLVDDLGTVTSVDAGTLTTVPRPTDLVAVVREVVAGLPEIDVELHADVPVGRATADPDRLFQVVSNLVSNGAQHGRGTVHVAVDEDDGDARVLVWDGGAGIPLERRQDVFDRFVRLGATETHSRGSGLGLAIARELTLAMGGRIAVVDHGDTSGFEIRLPLAPDPVGSARRA